ncbi:MAG: 6,7-dimethyl-8-ribityllumazine synthase [Cytophagales bacterium]|nr:MAG: 6,7-dimethyl-8-ribityllumazine synthase [Cytophagales bacterium]TAF60708.1 MAG: 6,7-dimethyl-8-ribityllumazine synthase [Cytophagales bacterium]
MLTSENQDKVYQINLDASFFTNKKIAVIVAEWNPSVTQAMREDAEKTLLKNGVQTGNILTLNVPGSFELTAAAAMVARNANYHAIICLGCVIQGETKHFDFICSSVAQGLTDLGIRYAMPVIFGVLTTNALEQALVRSNGQHSRKGEEAAIAALKMLHLSAQMAAPTQKMGF